MAQQILLRRGTALQWTTANPILAQGEQGLETDTNLIKIGDGSTTWTLLSYTSAIGLLKANNLSDLANVVTARTNLGLGTLATQNGTFSGTSSGTNTGDNAVNSSSQPVNTNLTSLSGLTYSSLSFIKMTAAGTFVLDTNTYLTTISGITAGGELSGTYPNPTLVNNSVTAKILTGLNITGGSISATDTIITAFGKLQNQINGVLGGAIFQSVWNASTNSPTLTSSVGTKGYYYIVSVAGSTNLDGITDWVVGDWAIYDGTVWRKVDNTDAVSSVNGFTGAVSLTTSHITEGSNLYFTNARVNTQVATYTGDVTLSGTVFSIGAGKVTNAMLASSIVGISNLSATGTPDSTTFLRGDNTWAVPAGGGGITINTTTITGGTDKKLLYNTSGVVGESSIYYDGTNTGFGTASPQARIDIVGNNGVRFLLYGTGGTAQYLAGLGVNMGQGTNSMGFFTGQNSDFTVEQATAFENFPYATGYTTRFVIARNTGNAGFNVISPTAAVHIKAGTTTVPSLKINSGTLVSTISGNVNDGALEYASSHLYFTIGSTRYQLDQQGGGVSDGDKGDVVVSSSGTVWTLDTVTANKGGTGQTSYAVGDLIYASASTTLSKLVAVATGNVLISGGITTAPSWGKVGLTTHVSGTLPVANGGTGNTSAGGIGSLLVGSGTTSFNTVAGNTTTTKKYLTQTGDGVDSNDPVWESLETVGISWITYSDTITWNSTAPSGATTHEYRYYQIGKMVFGFIRLEYANAGVTNTTLTLATNSFPVISKPSNAANGENMIACTGYIDSSNTGSPPATRCWMEASANTSGFVVKFIVGSQSAKFAMCSFTYLTA